MRLICPNCSTHYDVDASAIPPGGREVQCGVCDTVWFQPEPQTAAEPAPAVAEEPAVSPPVSEPEPDLSQVEPEAAAPVADTAENPAPEVEATNPVPEAAPISDVIGTFVNKERAAEAATTAQDAPADVADAASQKTANAVAAVRAAILADSGGAAPADAPDAAQIENEAPSAPAADIEDSLEPDISELDVQPVAPVETPTTSVEDAIAAAVANVTPNAPAPGPGPAELAAELSAPATESGDLASDALDEASDQATAALDNAQDTVEDAAQSARSATGDLAAAISAMNIGGSAEETTEEAAQDPEPLEAELSVDALEDEVSEAQNPQDNLADAIEAAFAQDAGDAEATDDHMSDAAEAVETIENSPSEDEADEAPDEADQDADLDDGEDAALDFGALSAAPFVAGFSTGRTAKAQDPQPAEAEPEAEAVPAQPEPAPEPEAEPEAAAEADIAAENDSASVEAAVLEQMMGEAEGLADESASNFDASLKQVATEGEEETALDFDAAAQAAAQSSGSADEAAAAVQRALQGTVGDIPPAEGSEATSETARDAMSDALARAQRSFEDTTEGTAAAALGNPLPQPGTPDPEYTATEEATVAERLKARLRAAALAEEDARHAQPGEIEDQPIAGAAPVAIAAASSRNVDAIPEPQDRAPAAAAPRSEMRPANRNSERELTAKRQARPAPKSRFAGGFIAALLVFALLALLYMFHQPISARLPQVEGPLGAYAQAVERLKGNVRGWFSGEAAEAEG